MKHLIAFLITAGLPVLLLVFMALYVQPVSGDLTRLGRLAEHDFGWNKPIPRLNKLANTHYTPDVIVLGDSFSRAHAWQSVVMQRTNLTLLYFDWDNIDTAACLASWIEKASERYPSAKILVIETIEREFVNRFVAPNKGCNASKYPGQAFTVKFHTGNSELTRARFKNMFPIDPFHVIHAAYNSWANYKPEVLNHYGKTRIAKLTRNDLFSSHRSDLLLFYTDDQQKKRWRQENIAQAANHARSITEACGNHGLALLMAVVPDKSTIYKDFMADSTQISHVPDVWSQLRRAHIPQTDIYDVLRRKVETTTDLYLPNDTHLSRAGYILMGEAIADSLGKLHVGLHQD